MNDALNNLGRFGVGYWTAPFLEYSMQNARNILAPPPVEDRVDATWRERLVLEPIANEEREQAWRSRLRYVDGWL